MAEVEEIMSSVKSSDQIMEEIPVSEQSNPLTENIDCCDSAGIVDLLYQSDKQIFNGWKDHMKLSDKEFIDKLVEASTQVSHILKSSEEGIKARIVIGGCGTSGRIAFLSSRAFNEYLVSCGKAPIFTYLIAGGDTALFASQEAPEDDPFLGALDLIQATTDCQVVLYIGVTCGLSAPYVAGQLAYCLTNSDKFTAVLVGFNPIYLARKDPIWCWDKTFHAVVEELIKSKGAVILNPIVGPESIAGSSRMKGGSATKIILELLFMMSLQQADKKDLEQKYGDVIGLYRKSCDHLYNNHSSEMSRLVDAAGESLCSGARVVYAGAGPAAILAMIDASECVPTFGSEINDIRGYLQGGYDFLKNKDGSLSHLDAKFNISWTDFVLNELPLLQEKDLVILINVAGCTVDEGLTELQESKAKLVCLNVNHTNSSSTAVSISTPSMDSAGLASLQRFIQQLTVKWVCNCISTGAHILKGKVFTNIMIDVRLSNRKLYHRAAAILMKLCGCTDRVAEGCIQSVVLRGSPHRTLLAAGEICKLACDIDLVLPTATLMLLAKCSFTEASQLLREEPVVRKAVSRYYTKVQH